ncbi:MAG: exodeoxyribonuclease VII large subunit [Betaproteobacteria bacterium]|nr:exodeoxyribonuclease VII large subunit [Betaproteobacteria bacterium]
MPTAKPPHSDGPLFDNPAPILGRQAAVIPVSELNRRARNLLEANLELLWVSGELSNVVKAASGHWYFSLKDSQAQVRCVMFRQRALAVGFVPENGMQVEVRALPSLYEPRGEFQLGVETMRRAGLGALFEAYERLKAKLAAEGLFDEERKRELPEFPKTLGIVTSLKAAALRDVLTTLRRRAPMIEIIIYPTAVQGNAAAGEIAAAIDQARVRLGTDGIDALIVCRGGGSIEDLWSFNEEVVARAIQRFQDDTGVPVVSGVGHETDFTICDFVADRRAPTPTAAAELLSPDIDELRMQVASTRMKLARSLQRALNNAQQRLDHAARGLISPADRLARERDRLALARTRARHAWQQQVESARFSISLLRQRHQAALPNVDSLKIAIGQRRTALAQIARQRIDQLRSRTDTHRNAMALLNPARVLERGYSIVEYNGAVLRDSSQLSPGDAIRVQLHKGALDAEVKAKS